MEAQQVVHGPAVHPGQAAQPGGGKAVAAGRGRQLPRVGDGLQEPVLLQIVDGLVDRAPGPAGDTGQLLPVEEGHIRQHP